MEENTENWETVRLEYFKHALFALANGLKKEDFEHAIKELEEDNIFAGCRGVMDAVELWERHPKDFNCKSVPYDERS